MPRFPDPCHLLIDALAESLEGSWLVAGDRGVVAAALSARGAQPLSWNRYATEAGPATALPPEVQVDRGILALPRGRPAQSFALEAMAARLAPGGTLYLYGSNDQGVKSVHKAVGPWFTDVEKLDARKHGRLLSMVRSDAPARDTLDAYGQPVSLHLPSGSHQFTAFPGLFARGGLDEATGMLLRSLGRVKSTPRRILDFACGMGVMLAEARLRWPDAELVGLDADLLAVEATRRSVLGAEVHAGDGFAAIEGSCEPGSFDLIVSNPPLHVGNQLDMRVLHELVTGASAWLTPKGSLWLVTQRQRPLPEVAGRTPRVITSTGRFCVWAL